MYIIKISESFTGLCNQLFALVSGILEARKRNIFTVYVTPFLTNIHSNNKVSIDKILNLEETSKKLGMNILATENNNGRLSFKWYTDYNEDDFRHVLSCITWNKQIYDIVNYLRKNYIKTKNLHVVHFRIEEDGANHWSIINKVTKNTWKYIIYNKYLSLIRKYIPENSHILALSYSTKDLLFTELAKSYKIYNFDVEQTALRQLGFTGREVCAIFDLLLGIQCNKTFIGCHNFTKQRGSTFSYILWQLMPQVEKGVFIDLDNINADEQVISLTSLQQEVFDENIYIYMHICTINDWYLIVKKVYDTIVNTQLIDKIKKMRIVVLGTELNSVLKLLNHPKVEVIYYSQDTSIYERKCLELLREHAFKENFKVLYLHSKGVSKSPEIKANVNDWVDYMLYFNVVKHNRCIELLNTYDTCGVNLWNVGRHISKSVMSCDYSNSAHYSGNFWWANSEYIKTLPEKVGPKYLDPELWIGQSPNKKMVSLWDSCINHYFKKYPKEIYENREKIFVKN